MCPAACVIFQHFTSLIVPHFALHNASFPFQIFLCLIAKKSVSAAFSAFGISSSTQVLMLLWLDDPQLLRLPEVSIHVLMKERFLLNLVHKHVL
jgi:hypothetical protein